MSWRFCADSRGEPGRRRAGAGAERIAAARALPRPRRISPRVASSAVYRLHRPVLPGAACGDRRAARPASTTSARRPPTETARRRRGCLRGDADGVGRGRLLPLRPDGGGGALRALRLLPRRARHRRPADAPVPRRQGRKAARRRARSPARAPPCRACRRSNRCSIPATARLLDRRHAGAVPLRARGGGRRQSRRDRRGRGRGLDRRAGAGRSASRTPGPDNPVYRTQQGGDDRDPEGRADRARAGSRPPARCRRSAPRRRRARRAARPTTAPAWRCPISPLRRMRWSATCRSPAFSSWCRRASAGCGNSVGFEFANLDGALAAAGPDLEAALADPEKRGEARLCGDRAAEPARPLPEPGLGRRPGSRRGSIRSTAIDRRALLAGAGAALAAGLAPRQRGRACDERSAVPGAGAARRRQLRGHAVRRAGRAHPRDRAAGARPRPRGAPAERARRRLRAAAGHLRGRLRRPRRARAAGLHGAAGPALFRPWRLFGRRQAALRDRERFRSVAGRDRRLRRDRRLPPHRRVFDARNRHARGDPDAGREDARHRQRRDRDASGLRPRDAEHPDHGPLARLRRPASGHLIAQHRLPPRHHQLSIRHMAVAADGAIWFGTQWEGDPLEGPSLVGRASLEKGLELAETPEPERNAMRNYVGAMAASRDGSLICASAPRGGLIAYWSAETGRHGRARRRSPIRAASPALARRASSPPTARGSSSRPERRRQPGCRAPARHAFDNHLRMAAT